MAMKLSISIGMLKQDAFKGILYFKSPSGASLLKISAAFRRNIYNPPTSSKSFLKGSSIRSTRIPISVAEKSWARRSSASFFAKYGMKVTIPMYYPPSVWVLMKSLNRLQKGSERSLRKSGTISLKKGFLTQMKRYSLLKSNKDVIGDAFEVFAESKLVGEKGEFFTPREVVKMAVRVVDPKPRQTVCDPACGSGGFLIYAVEHIWKSMQQDRQWKGLSEETLRREQRKMAERSFYGIDKEIDLVKITKAYMSIIGDGKSKVVQENTLHEPCEYNPRAKMLFVQDEATHTIRKFDCILTNPPFGSKIKVLEADSGQFELGYKWKEIEGVWHKTDEIKNTEPQVLFIERCLQMLRTEGKLQQEFITMGVCEGIGHDHNGKPLYRYDENKKHFTEEIWDNSIDIMEELKAPSHPDNHYVFRVPTRNIKGSVYVPRYYWKKYSVQIEERAKKEHFQLVSIQKLLDE